MILLEIAMISSAAASRPSILGSDQIGLQKRSGANQELAHA